MATTALAVVPEQDERDLSKLSLDELAAAANEEHREVIVAGGRMLLHAIRAGEALNRAWELSSRGEWQAWLEANFNASHRTANTYRRIAHYRDALPDSIDSVQMARNHLVGLPFAMTRLRPLQQKAVKLHAEGHTYEQIGEEIGVDRHEAWRLVNPDRYRDRKRREAASRRKADRLLAAQEREQAIRRAVKSSGKGVSKVYASLERIRDEFAEAREEVDGLADIEALLHKVRDEFVAKALGVS